MKRLFAIVLTVANCYSYESCVFDTSHAQSCANAPTCPNTLANNFIGDNISHLTRNQMQWCDDDDSFGNVNMIRLWCDNELVKGLQFLYSNGAKGEQVGSNSTGRLVDWPLDEYELAYVTLGRQRNMGIVGAQLQMTNGVRSSMCGSLAKADSVTTVFVNVSTMHMSIQINLVTQNQAPISEPRCKLSHASGNYLRQDDQHLLAGVYGIGLHFSCI